MRRLLVLAVLIVLLVPASAGAVVGGGPATEAYPWMVSLQYNGRHYCGASLVRPDWILTAAHCVDGGRQPASYKAVLGRHRLSSSDGERIDVDQIVVHEKYASDQAGGHDVALLHLARPSGAPRLRTVSLSEAALWAPGRPARVMGWGTSVFLVGPGFNDLQEVDVSMVSDQDCSTSYNAASLSSFDPTTMVCAGEPYGTKDSCQGDSGGPLVVKDASAQWTQVGTVSFGQGCGFPFFYGVYGRVGGPVLNQWIAARLPSADSPASSAAGGATPPAGAPGAASTGTGSGRAPVPSRTGRSSRVGFARDMKAARRLLRLRVTSSGRVTGLRAVLVRRLGKRRVVVVARGRLSLLNGAGTVLLPARRPAALRRARLSIELRGTDAAGRIVAASGAVRVVR